MLLTPGVIDQKLILGERLKIGNILAAAGIIIGVIGLTGMPFIVNPTHQLWTIDQNVKSGGWNLLAVAGIFSNWAGLMLIGGIFLFAIAKLLPKKYWKSD